MSKTWDIHSAVKQIKGCDFECEAGPLTNNVGWAWLASTLESGPKYALGQLVYYEVSAEVGGVRISNSVRFTIVGIRMDSTADGLAWKYSLSNDPPGAYHYGTTAFSNIAEAELVP